LHAGAAAPGGAPWRRIPKAPPHRGTVSIGVRLSAGAAPQSFAPGSRGLARARVPGAPGRGGGG
jgi:hypothetical protein